MPEIQVTLTGFEEKPGENANGAYVLTKFKSDDGKQYQTFDEELAQTLKNKIGKGPFGLEFEVQSRTNNGRTFTNNVAMGVVSQVDAGGGSAAASGGGSSAVMERLTAFNAALQLVSIVSPESLDFSSVAGAADTILGWAEGSLAGSDDIEPDATDAVPD